MCACCAAAEMLLAGFVDENRRDGACTWDFPTAPAENSKGSCPTAAERQREMCTLLRISLRMGSACVISMVSVEVTYGRVSKP